MTPLTKLDELKISELSGVDDPANMAPGWLILKSRGLIDDDGDLTPDGALVVRKGLAEGKVLPQDILSPDELAKARAMQPRPFIEAFGAIHRPPGRGY